MPTDLIIYNAGQLLTLTSPGKPKRGTDMADLGIVEDGAVAVHEGQIVAVGHSAEILSEFSDALQLDAEGQVVMPGFVDPHTHVVWAGERAGEFELRVAGASYMEIMAAGGGIMSTVRATRAASLNEIAAQTRPRLDIMLAHGTTTAEAKSGYGLTLEDELKLLQAIHLLDESHPVDLVPTFLGAHAVPSEYAGRTDEYVDLVVEEMIPAVANLRYREAETSKDIPAARFCDVFCEAGVFDLDQSRRILETAKKHHMGLKIHSDEFEPLGGTLLAVELGAVSADHLVRTTPEQLAALAASDTIAVALPGTPFGLGEHEYTPARSIIDQGGALALATDLNPGTCWCESMQLMIALACRYMRMTPAEAITAATINAAHAVASGNRVASLEVGKQADILILNVSDYRHLGYRFGTNLVRTVIKHG
ncbi:MAG TPA: imidazolonepropionase, partial [Anaerolineae bacterium]|nr:imidazolonepropionase [Anaerolineae bacterium]